MLRDTLNFEIFPYFKVFPIARFWNKLRPRVQLTIEILGIDWTKILLSMPRLPSVRVARGSRRWGGFTLLEVLVAGAVTALLVVVMLSVLQSTSNIWQKTSGRAKSFAAARAAFESISSTIGAATLNTYLDYYNSSRQTRPSGSLTFAPAIYGRQSDLHFVTGNNLVSGQLGGAVFFVAPFDWESGAVTRSTGGQLNGVGFFVRYGPDPDKPSFITDNPSRFRLFQFLQPTDVLKVMNGSFSGNRWFQSDINANPPKFCYPLAEHVVAFTVLPKLSERENDDPSALTSDYSYDTRVTWGSGPQPTSMHQLPPVVRVVMVVLDEVSAQRLPSGSTPPDLGFNLNSVLQDPANLEDDIETISAALAARNLNFRVFRADVPLRGARWSAQ